MNPFFLGRRSPEVGSKGFSLIELLAVIAIIAILALIIFPSLMRFLPNSRVRADSRALATVMQKARLRAATIQKPIRVVLNCTQKPCFVDMQAAIYGNPTLGEDGSSVKGWTSINEERHRFNDNVSAIKLPSACATCYDGAVTVAGVTYAIFMPGSHVFSDPRPYEIFLYYNQGTAAVRPGWRLSVSNDSGRVITKRDEVGISVP
jgi:prepilin-type N-terminal cleavage/methylation domain-containing protein